LPIIVASGKGAKDIREFFRDEKQIAFVGKPYLANDLYGALRELGIPFQAQIQH
jgi:hypothetical protein